MVPRGSHLLWLGTSSFSLCAQLTPVQGEGNSSTYPGVFGKMEATCPAPTHSIFNFHLTKMNQHTHFEGRGGKSKRKNL